MVLEERLKELKQEFDELEQPLMRYMLLLRLADYAPQVPCDFTTEEYLFPGCQSNVWLKISDADGRTIVELTSDSKILRGVCLVIMRLVEDLPAEEYASLSEVDVLDVMGLSDQFESTRQDGIRNILKTLSTCRSR